MILLIVVLAAVLAICSGVWVAVALIDVISNAKREQTDASEPGAKPDERP